MVVLSLGFACSVLIGDLIGMHLLHKVLLSGALELCTLLCLGVVFLADVGDNTHRVRHRERVVPHKASYGLSHVVDLRHLNEQWYVIIQGSIVGIIIPGENWQTTLLL